MIREMRIRNYSDRTIESYICCIAQLCKYYQAPPDQLTTRHLKDYIHHLLHEKHFSVSLVNQLISAWRIIQTDVLGNKWEDILIKRPRADKDIPQVPHLIFYINQQTCYDISISDWRFQILH